MAEKKMMGRILVGAVLVAGTWGIVELTAERTFAVADKKSEPPAVKSGTVVGVVTARKEKGWLEVKADGEEKARRYYRFGNRAELNKQIDLVVVGARVRIEWEARNEGPHIAKIEILKKAEEKKD